MVQSGFMRLRTLHDQLSKSDQKIADYVLSQADGARTLTIQTIADNVGLSTATVSRFVKRIGFNSFREFSLSLTMPTQSSDTFFGEIESQDGTTEIVHKVFSGARNALDATYSLISEETWQTALEWLITGNKIGLFGIGGSAIVALDGYHKLLRTPLDVEQHPDYDVQLMQAVRMKKGDVGIVISHSGRNHDTLKIARQLKQNNVKIIAITAHVHSELAKLADLVMASSAEEVNMRSESMSSLLAQITIMDSLFTLVGVKMGDKTLSIVDNMREAIEGTRE
ncbi:MurR/RpiR family transcriptional regulator [Weissella halotolerans]|uniref:Transcriptional regulator n=1 Tax=Weissella halotolerans DSM 20190 TaxID=1123500 RepID=A0A0R2FRS1_9LACO|nr:MurR/RpiR family transcriptional regulator [Weissella halotolerans]KRN31187.1 transcriptional regulator [Weissella halotolerans DSM 20190]